MSMCPPHASRFYGVRLHDEDMRKLETLVEHFDRPAADVLRTLVRQAMPLHIPTVEFCHIPPERIGNTEVNHGQKNGGGG
jgi:hypothetical protein